MAQIIAAFLIITLYLIYPDSSQAAYLIQLKNGREFITSRYWVEGNQVMFYTSGGVLGIEKDLISKIEETDRPFKSETAVSKAPETVKKEGEETAVEKREGSESVDVEGFREKKSMLQGKFDEASKRHLEAISNKDSKAKEKARKEMIESSRQIYELTDELKKKNEGVLPADWWGKKGP